MEGKTYRFIYGHGAVQCKVAISNIDQRKYVAPPISLLKFDVSLAPRERKLTAKAEDLMRLERSPCGKFGVGNAFPTTLLRVVLVPTMLLWFSLHFVDTGAFAKFFQVLFNPISSLRGGCPLYPQADTTSNVS